MAIYRNIQMSFWTDSKIVDDYTPEDRYFYLYLMTNPHTNLCGCYEVSIKQVADETGYSKETVEKLFRRMAETHKSVFYSKETKEVLLVNWGKYNWTKSEKFRKPLGKEIESVKNAGFREFLTALYENEDSVLIPYPYGSDTTVTVTDTDTVTVSDTDSVTDTDSVVNAVDPEKESKKVTSKDRKKKQTVYYPNDGVLNQAFMEYVEMRELIKKPMTDRAVTLAMKKLEELATSPPSGSMDNDLAVKILEQSTMNCWQGLFPLKEALQGNNVRQGGIDWSRV